MVVAEEPKCDARGTVRIRTAPLGTVLEGRSRARGVTTQGIVVGDFEGSSGLQDFYLQDASGDADAATSDGIFVFPFVLERAALEV